MLKQIIFIIISLNIIEARRSMPDMSKQFKQIKNNCNKYAINVSNIYNNIENTTYCKSYFNNNTFYDIKYIKNCTNDIVLNNFIKVRYECIKMNNDSLSSGIIISLLMWIIIPLCFQKERKYERRYYKKIKIIDY
jgi:hypothetical protein